VDLRAQTQLAILRQLQDAFAAARVRWWRRGGLAIDFMLGLITRPHRDIDIVVWGRHRRRVYRVLSEAGFALAREGCQTSLTFKFMTKS
jgi:hypothetical protein